MMPNLPMRVSAVTYKDVASEHFRPVWPTCVNIQRALYPRLRRRLLSLMSDSAQRGCGRSGKIICHDMHGNMRPGSRAVR
jgi:hypothetical protein